MMAKKVIDGRRRCVCRLERCSQGGTPKMIAAAALHAGCGTLWSKEMQDGMLLDGRLRVVNPFGAS